MILVDTHCHLQDRRFENDREEVITRALESLEWIAVVGDDLPNSEMACRLVRPGVYAIVGFHPYHGEMVNAETITRLRELCGQPGVIAVGETGLDYHNEFCPRPAQREAFVQQLTLAAETGLPVVIHNRDADEDTLAILREHAPSLAGVVMHCFGSDASVAEQCVELGFYVSFAGNVTFPKAQSLRDAADVVPINLLLAETDAPYLAPQPLRGQRCEPAYVLHTLEALAKLKGVPAEILAASITANAQCLFHIPGRS